MVVLFDFDEVFVDLNTGALKYINAQLGTNYTMNDVTSWDFFDKPGVNKPFFEYLSLPDVYQKHVIPNQKMIEVLKQMVEMGVDAYIVTASFESSCESKYQFIKEHMSFFDTNRMFTVNGSSKYKMKSDVLDELKLSYHQPIVLIDDGIHNILDMMADIKHKEKLDDLMKQFYSSRTLKKFNNPYHEFIYGIVPELTYNKDIVDGKRIFKIKEASEVWKLLKSISGQHKIRVKTKQAEVFNYLFNMVNEWLPEKDFKQFNELQHNAAFLTKSVLRKHTKHVDFLSEIVRLNVLVEGVQAAHEMNDLATPLNEINKTVHENIFNSADKKFGSDVMYQEIKNLVFLHTAKESFPENAQLGQAICETYKVNVPQVEGGDVSILKSIIELSKENIQAGKNLVASMRSPEHKEVLATLLHTAGMAYNIDYKDRPALTANAILAFNKNFVLEKSPYRVVAQDEEIDSIKQMYIQLPKKNNKRKIS